MNRSRIQEAALSNEEAEVLRQWCRQFRGDPYGSDHAEYDRELHARIDGIPDKLYQLACWFGDHVGMSGVQRFRGLPVPRDIPPTPNVPYFQVRAPLGTEPLLLGISMLVGDAVAFKDWRGGDRVHNIYPLSEDATTQKASNVVRLAMHTETAFHPEAPEALAILCLRDGISQPPVTGFCDLHPLWDDLEAGDRSLLRESGFCFSGRHRDGSPFLSEPMPIVTSYRKGLRFHYVDSLLGSSPRHEGALRRLREGIEQTTVEVTLAPGDLVLIDNLHMVHGRTAVSPRYDGRDRWLQRCLIRKSAGPYA